MNFMQLRPMMPRPPAMIRRLNDLPDFPQLLNQPDPLVPANDGTCVEFSWFLILFILTPFQFTGNFQWAATIFLMVHFADYS